MLVDHKYICLDKSSLVRIEGEFLETVLPLKSFATLTSARWLSEESIVRAFDDWLCGVQAYERTTLGWIRTIEARPRRHLHVALIAACELDCEYAAMLWRRMVAPRYSEAAKVERYRRDLCGLSYILKQLPESSDCVQVSENLPAFALDYKKSLFRTNSAQRRQQRRIMSQLSGTALMAGWVGGKEH